MKKTNRFRAMAGLIGRKAGLAGLSLSLMVGQAMAALPEGVGTAITGIQADGKAIFDLVFPVVAAFLGLAVVIKLFKRFTNKV